MKKTALQLTIALLAVCCFMPVQAQVSEGGTPPGFGFDSFRSSTASYEVPVYFDVDELLAEDEANAGLNMPLRCAYIIPVRLSMDDFGEWFTLPDGTFIWQAEIHARGALAITLSYERFIIPEGGKLFLYNPEHTKVLGAYTSNTNPSGEEFATEFVYGDRLILEYVAPEGIAENPEIIIDGIHYGYNHIWTPEVDGNPAKSAKVEACMININCPEGDDWQTQKKGVARIYCGGYLCTGTMIMNTAMDFDPLFLSAFHCYEKVSANQIKQSIYYFHYESANCTSNTLGPNTKTISGAEYLVKIPWDGGSDGALLRLNSPIPESYDVYFNGWDRRNVPSSHGVCIHHPDGAVKKISTYLEPLSSMTFNTCATDAHWKVYWSETVTGRSSTEGGSSGSPIFTPEKLVLGTLSGGYASCSNNQYDAYGKLWYHWDQYASQKMNQYLDPIGSGVEKLNGSYMIMADFTWEPEEVFAGHPILFTCQSKGVTTRDWTFENGTPATSTEQNPEVVFNLAGEAMVTLTINKGAIDESTRTVTIDVQEEIPPAADFVMNGSEEDTVEIHQGQKVVFKNRSEGTKASYHWTFEGGDPAESAGADATVTYMNTGTFGVTLKVESYLGTDTKEKTVVVTTQPPAVSFASSSGYLNKYPYGEFLPYEGGSVTFYDTSENFPVEWSWSLEGADPSSASSQQVEALYPAGQESYQVILAIGNDSGSAEIIKEDYIQTGGASPVWNIPQGETGEEIFRLSGGGYLAGTNDHYSTVAEKFENAEDGSIDRVDLYIKVQEGDVSDNYYGIQIYTEKDGLPDVSLYTKTFNGTSIDQDGYTSITFDRTIEVDGTFFVAVSGLSSTTSGVAIGAANNAGHMAYIRTGGQWKSLYNYFSGAWSISMNIVPYFTYKPSDVAIPLLDIAANTSVYPNPATNVLNIESGAPIESVTIQDLQGRNILHTGAAMQNKLTLAVDRLTPGIYLVKVQTEQGSVVSKLVKK